jgi:hypothetical protein
VKLEYILRRDKDNIRARGYSIKHAWSVSRSWKDGRRA